MRDFGIKTLTTLALIWLSGAALGLAQVADDDQGKLRPGVVAPGGRVTATGIDAAGLARLKTRIESGKFTNIDVVRVRTDDPLLEPNAFVAVLIRKAYHEMSAHHAILRHIREALKPDGRRGGLGG